MAVQLSLPGFQGAAGILVGELEAGKRPVEEVSLAALSTQFRDWLRDNEDADLLAAGELLRTGARLTALKSAHLLASPVEEEPEDEPEMIHVDDPLPWQLGTWLRERQDGEAFAPIVPEDLVPRRVVPRSSLSLLTSLRDMEKRRSARTTRVPVPAFVRLEVAVSSLIRQLKSGARLSLRRLLSGKNRQDAVVHFLAVLDLIRRRQAQASQPSLFDDITVEWIEDAASAESRAG